MRGLFLWLHRCCVVDQENIMVGALIVGFPFTHFCVFQTKLWALRMCLAIRGCRRLFSDMARTLWEKVPPPCPLNILISVDIRCWTQSASPTRRTFFTSTLHPHQVSILSNSSDSAYLRHTAHYYVMLPVRSTFIPQPLHYLTSIVLFPHFGRCYGAGNNWEILGEKRARTGREAARTSQILTEELFIFGSWAYK